MNALRFQAAGSRTEAGLLLAGGFVVIVGFVDDRWGLSAISKLAAQVAAAGILVWSGQSLPWLPTPSGGVFSLEPDLSVTLTILARLSGSTIQVSGRIPITFADWDIPNPSFVGVVTTRDHGTLEFLLNFTHA